MADDEDTPETPAEAQPTEEQETPAAEAQETPAAEEHAAPTEEATEIAAVAEDAPLEALQEALAKAPAEEPVEPVADASVEAAGEGHAVPTVEATEIAGVAEDAPLEALQESADKESQSEETATGESQAEESAGEPVAAEDETDEDEEDEEPAPRVKPAVPGAHLEVDIVPEGVDPLGRSEAYEDPYAIEGEEPEQAGEGQEGQEEALSEPISTAAIDLASGARYRATGKRKTAVARVTLRPGSGTYLVNGRALEEHFPRVTLQRNIRQPLETVGYQERMDVVARLHGGGISAQAGALRHGVSRALLEADPNLRGELKRRGFLTRDSRAKERKKAGLKKARKRPQFSKR
jgi:small subunit ribosomal protein S9